MADVKWIKITTDIFDDEKILLIESLPEADSIIVIWFKLLCFAGKTNNNGVFLMNDRIAYTDSMLATIFRRKETTVRLALETFEKFGMIERIDNVITIPNWNKHQTLDAYERKKERDRQYQAERRAEKKALISKSSDKSYDESSDKSSDKSSDVVSLEKEEEKEKDIERDNNILCASENAQQKNNPSKNEINDLFERLWKLYPCKKGKGQVSDARKKKLYEIGYEEMERAIQRYAAELEKDASWRKPQNGSTFFNSGYIDYLDCNYTQETEQRSGNNEQHMGTDTGYDEEPSDIISMYYSREQERGSMPNM